MRPEPPQGQEASLSDLRVGVAGGRAECRSRRLTLVGAVGVGLVAEVPTVIVPVAGPVLGDAPSAVALELGAGAGVTAAGLVAVIPTVVVWGGGGGERGRESEDPVSGTPFSVTPARPTPPRVPTHSPPHPTPRPHGENDQRKSHRNKTA